jgi:hypothetical protein
VLPQAFRACCVLLRKPSLFRTRRWCTRSAYDLLKGFGWQAELWPAGDVLLAAVTICHLLQPVDARAPAAKKIAIIADSKGKERHDRHQRHFQVVRRFQVLTNC